MKHLLSARKTLWFGVKCHVLAAPDHKRRWSDFMWQIALLAVNTLRTADSASQSEATVD